MNRTIATHMKATATLALACTMALVFAVATVQAHPARTAGSHIGGPVQLHDRDQRRPLAHPRSWPLRNKSTLKARDVSCSSVRAQVAAFTHRAGLEFGAFPGPSGFKCKSFSTAASGDKLLYSGVCMHGPHNDPFFARGRKVPGH